MMSHGIEAYIITGKNNNDNIIFDYISINKFKTDDLLQRIKEKNFIPNLEIKSVSVQDAHAIAHTMLDVAGNVDDIEITKMIISAVGRLPLSGLQIVAFERGVFEGELYLPILVSDETDKIIKHGRAAYFSEGHADSFLELRNILKKDEKSHWEYISLMSKDDNNIDEIFFSDGKNVFPINL